MKKKTLNPFRKFQYSKILRAANVYCEDQPPQSEAHFVAFYALMMHAMASRLDEEQFKTLLFTANEKLTINYSLYGIFKAIDHYHREQTTLKLADFYAACLTAKEDKEASLALRRMVAGEYATAVSKKLEEVDVALMNGAAVMEKFSSLRGREKQMMAIILSSDFKGKSLRFV